MLADDSEPLIGQAEEDLCARALRDVRGADVELFLALLEEEDTLDGEERLLACCESFARIASDARVDAMVLMDALHEVGFVQRVLAKARSRHAPQAGDRLYARPSVGGGDWLRGTLEQIVRADLFVVVLDAFVGRFHVKRVDVAFDWELADDSDSASAGGSEGACELCARPSRLTAHHLRPREVHARYLKRGMTRDVLAQCAMLCRPCHSAVVCMASCDAMTTRFFFFYLICATS